MSVPFELEPIDESALDAHGEVFTRRWVVEMILDLVGYTADRDLVGMNAIEPSCGAGAFLVPMIERLADSAERYGRDLEEAEDALNAWDLLGRNVVEARSAAVVAITSRGLSRSLALHLAEAWVRHADFLLEPPAPKSADYAVGNPPYIRLEAIASGRSKAYRQNCETMGGRSDIYIGFHEKALQALRPGGRLGFICADRWMRNAYGARLRDMISQGWSVETIVHMTGVDAFENEVDAYPAVTVIRRSAQDGGPLVADADSAFGPAAAKQLVALANDAEEPPSARSEVENGTDAFRAARLSSWFTGRSGWPNASPERLKLLADLEARLPPLEDSATGTKVGIGVATGADKVFITEQSNGVEEARLLPLAMSRDISGGLVEWSGKYLVNPWDDSGLVDLTDWPGLRSYLTLNEETLRGRHTARSGKWHKTIDRVINGLASRPKLYLPDFKEAIFPVLDSGGTYPHHNLYWVISEKWDLEVLGGLLLSDIANLFIEAYSVRMRGGYLRFQAQYLRRIRLPRLEDVGPAAAVELAGAFRDRDRDKATAVALDLYGIDYLPS
jgi:hypothetical protein